ncbi:RidA family protein [Deltaproteobacteria bacterium]|nr:RidA family protein [Deltaproteobacteria bacterium]
MEKIETTKAPAAIGPYSQAVRAGDYLYCSGQIPLLPDSGEMVAGGVAEQTRQVLDNLGQVLIAAGGDFSAVVKTTIYLVDLADFTVVNEIYAEYCVSIAPARATVQVAALPKGALVEIDAVAYCGK